MCVRTCKRLSVSLCLCLEQCDASYLNKRLRVHRIKTWEAVVLLLRQRGQNHVHVRWEPRRWEPTELKRHKTQGRVVVFVVGGGRERHMCLCPCVRFTHSLHSHSHTHTQTDTDRDRHRHTHAHTRTHKHTNTVSRTHLPCTTLWRELVERIEDDDERLLCRREGEALFKVLDEISQLCSWQPDREQQQKQAW